MSEERKDRLRLVRWRDARGDGGEWQDLDEVMAQDVAVVRSVGYVLLSTDREVLLAAHICDDANLAVGVMHIPRSAVISEEPLYYAEDLRSAVAGD